MISRETTTPDGYRATFDAAADVAAGYDRVCELAGLPERPGAALRKVPEHLRSGIARHCLFGDPVGSFLTSVFDNDFVAAAVRADEGSLAGLREIALFLANDAPRGAWGSADRAEDWRRAGGLAGHVATAAFLGRNQADASRDASDPI